MVAPRLGIGPQGRVSGRAEGGAGRRHESRLKAALAKHRDYPQHDVGAHEIILLAVLKVKRRADRESSLNTVLRDA